MLLFVLRKMLNNKWMVICLLIGSILTAAMVSSIPLYTNGILQRMLTKDLQNSQETSGRYPGLYYFKTSFGGYADYSDKSGGIVNAGKVAENFYNDMGIPALAKNTGLLVELELKVNELEEKSQSKQFVKLQSALGLEQHVDIISGKMFSSKPENGIYEVIINEQAMKELDLSMDRIYYLADYMEDFPKNIKVKIVGVFTYKDPADPFWFEGLWKYNKSILINYSLMNNEILSQIPNAIVGCEWYYALDYHKITISNMGHILNSHNQQKLWLKKNVVMSDFRMQCIPTLEQYFEREKLLRTTLWILQVPIFIILAFYIFMVSRLIIDYERNEIAVLKSRGASGFQIFASYLIESLILTLITIAIGPPLGLLLCRVMGASNGFLEFVQRTALQIPMSWSAYIYTCLAMVLFIATMLVPAIMVSRTTIVTHKQEKARRSNKAVWHKFFIDAVLLLLSGYGYYRYSVQKKTLALSGVKGIELAIDPLLFLTSTFFILGAGLLFLRLFPYIVRLVFWLGRRLWHPVLYASFIQVGRSGGQEQFLMLFIIFTLAIGLFNSNSARTLNRGVEDRAAYEAGSDLAVQAKWETDQQAVLEPASMDEMQTSMSFGAPKQGHYIEPYFVPYTQLEGVEEVTKVLINNSTSISMPTATGKINSAGNVSLMGIIPHEFGEIAWFRDGLLPYHINQYLNLMTSDRTAVLLSTSFREKYGVKEGDPVSITWSGQSALSGVVYAFIDYWPTFNPNARKETDKAQTRDFVVANLSYIQDEMAMEPYEVWIKKKPGVSSSKILSEIKDKKLPDIVRLRDRASMVVERKNDPLLQGTNGSLTLGFIVTILICAIGFLIYWILSIKSRLLQFGIFRAMGLTRESIIGMLLCEQVLVSGTSMLAGILIGKTASKLFIKLFEIIYSSEQQVLPFKVVEHWQDYVRLYGAMGVVMLLGFAILGTIIVRIKVNQVIKLGED